LRDNYNNIVQNLTIGNYIFSTVEGTFTDRFDIIYQNLLDISNPTLDVNQIIIYNNNQTTFINSEEFAMDSLKYLIFKVDCYLVNLELMILKHKVNHADFF
jgi:hypothetical protein